MILVGVMSSYANMRALSKPDDWVGLSYRVALISPSRVVPMRTFKSD
jgi:hypothetical protein